MMKYKLPKGTKIRRMFWKGIPPDIDYEWEDFVTTKDAYYTERDVLDKMTLNDGTDTFKFKIPDRSKYECIRVYKRDVHIACIDCGYWLDDGGYGPDGKRCKVCDLADQIGVL